MTSYQVNPFRGDINPGNADGLHLFLKAIEPLDEEDRYELDSESAKPLMDHLLQVSKRFGWSKLTDRINVGTTTDQDLKSILVNGSIVKTEDVVRQAWEYFGNGSPDAIPDGKTIKDIDPANKASHRPLFFKRVKSEMISKYLEGCLSKSALKQLSLRKDEYTWTDSSRENIVDGPTMLKVVVDTVNPSTRVGVGNLMEEIEQATMAKYDENIDELLKHMQEMYNQILNAGEMYPHFLRYLFKALLTAKNAIFAKHYPMHQRQLGNW